MPVPLTTQSMSVKVYSDLRKCISRDSTRGELANLTLPPVTDVMAGDIQLVIDPSCLSNPLALDVRPSEAAIRESYKRLDAADEDAEDVGVRIGCLGTFNSCSLGIWKRACKAASLKWRVEAEIKWLDENNKYLPPEAYVSVKRVLLNAKPKQHLLSIFIDAVDFASLIGERWLTGFIIDVICMRLVSIDAHTFQPLCSTGQLLGTKNF